MIHSRMATARAMLVGVSAGMLLVSLRHNVVLSEMRLRCDRADRPPSCALRFQFRLPDLLNFVSPDRTPVVTGGSVPCDAASHGPLAIIITTCEPIPLP